jgi:hypothetical protein
MVQGVQAALVLLAVATLAFSGCFGGQAQEAVPTTPPQLPPGYEMAEEGHDEEAGTGSIVGNVVDDEYQPLKGAVVGFIEPYVADVTDKAGFFEIGNLAPGPWDLYVIHMGHKADGLRVNVKAGDATRVTFQLPVLPVEEPWVETIAFEGRIDRAVVLGGFGSSCCGAGLAGGFALSDSATAVTGMVVGVDWSPTHTLASGLRLIVRADGDGQQPELLRLEGPEGPLVGAVEPAVLGQALGEDGAACGEDVCQLRWSAAARSGGLTSGPDAVGFAYEQPFYGAVSVFYRTPVPEGHSPLPDA